jgi:hypothetical protein
MGMSAGDEKFIFNGGLINVWFWARPDWSSDVVKLMVTIRGLADGRDVRYVQVIPSQQLLKQFDIKLPYDISYGEPTGDGWLLSEVDLGSSHVNNDDQFHGYHDVTLDVDYFINWRNALLSIAARYITDPGQWASWLGTRAVPVMAYCDHIFYRFESGVRAVTDRKIFMVTSTAPQFIDELDYLDSTCIDNWLSRGKLTMHCYEECKKCLEGGGHG